MTQRVLHQYDRFNWFPPIKLCLWIGLLCSDWFARLTCNLWIRNRFYFLSGWFHSMYLLMRVLLYWRPIATKKAILSFIYSTRLKLLLARGYWGLCFYCVDHRSRVYTLDCFQTMANISKCRSCRTGCAACSRGVSSRTSASWSVGWVTRTARRYSWFASPPDSLSNGSR